MTDLTLTIAQQHAIDVLWDGLKAKRRKRQTLGGYAGTGKTTIISHMIRRQARTAVCAFTGKAANVLRKKGVDASTIHSLIYEPVFFDGTVTFRLRLHLDCDLIVVDEASMVSADLYRDLMSFGIPVIFVGDHGQLEPVGSDFNIMQEPDVRLEEIHRNAGDVARFAEWLRFDRPASEFRGDEGRVVMLDRGEMRSRGFVELASRADQVICAYNKTRCDLNAKIRSHLGRSGMLTVGEKVMCLKNDKDHGIFNGMQGTAVGHSVKDGRHHLDFESNGQVYPAIRIPPEQFGAEKTLKPTTKDGAVPFDYAYAITCHKSQGDQFREIVVVEQRCDRWEHRRWAYTAASRAEERIYWVAS